MSISLKKSLMLRMATTLCVLMHKTYRYRYYNTSNRLEAETLHERKAFAIASWHQNCFAGILAHAGQGIALLVSKSLDGEIVSRLAHSIGLKTVRGSSKKGGKEALAVLVDRTAEEGLRSALTIDGPKGPIYEIKRGILSLSMETGAPILPLFAIGARYWTLNKSWDKFRIPKPFTRVSVFYGKPFVVDPVEFQTNYEGLRARLASELRTLEVQAINMGLAVVDVMTPVPDPKKETVVLAS